MISWRTTRFLSLVFLMQLFIIVVAAAFWRGEVGRKATASPPPVSFGRYPPVQVETSVESPFDPAV